MITLAQAIKEGRLEDFVRQQDAAGVSPIKEAAFLRATAKLIKHGPPDQPSHPSSRDDPPETEFAK